MNEYERSEHDDDPLPASGYRTYEVYQRERVRESAPPLTPRELIGDEMLTDPYRLLGLLREHDPCYRDWVGNRFWITRYDDVTSVFVDDANYETRSTAWWLGVPDGDAATDLSDDVEVLQTRADRIDHAAAPVIDRLVGDAASRLRRDGRVDIAVSVAARLPLALWSEVLALPADDDRWLATCLWTIERGRAGERERRAAIAAFADLVARLEGLLGERTGDGDATDLVSVIARREDDPHRGAQSLARFILESDHATLHGGLANLWFLLLTHPEEFEEVESDHRLVKFAWLEALRHSPPVMAAQRFARHEVERFGKLLPAGAMLHCSAGAANRDPRVFADPDDFVVRRSDLCQREPRGQYRADGLPSGVAFGLGQPSIHPAVPRERPRSIYAITRDVAVAATTVLLETLPGLSITEGAAPVQRSLALGGMRTCWQLSVSR